MHTALVKSVAYETSSKCVNAAFLLPNIKDCLIVKC